MGMQHAVEIIEFATAATSSPGRGSAQHQAFGRKACNLYRLTSQLPPFGDDSVFLVPCPGITRNTGFQYIPAA